METTKKLIVGYDLCEDFTQISLYSYKTHEPISISTGDGEEDSIIPTVLCAREDAKQWLYGKEAISCSMAGEGVLIEHLLKKLLIKEDTEIFGQKFSGIQLLEKFFRRTLSLIKNYFPNDTITKLVVTVSKTIPALVGGIYEALSLLGIEKDRAFILSHPGAFLYYVLSQDKTLWMNDVGLFDFGEEGLRYDQLSINRRTKPMIAGITKSELSQLLNMEGIRSDQKDAAYLFENIAGTTLYKQIVSTLFFTGKGFEGGWADGVIRSLCIGRRVFQGQNLYTKGACYAALEQTADGNLKEFLILTEDMITTSIGIRVYLDAKIQDLILVDSGEIWYEIHKSIEVIPDEASDLELVFKNRISRETVRKRLPLKALPDRPNRMTRLEITLSFRNKNTANFTVKDLGFGDLHQETGYSVEFAVELQAVYQ